MDRKSFSRQSRLLSTLGALVVALLSTWMGSVNGGYFVGDWALSAFVVTALVFLVSVLGRFSGMNSWLSTLAVGSFVAYTTWTFASLYWSPNQGDAWLGAGQTLLYLLAFWSTLSLIASGASRRWVLVATVLGPAVVALYTLLNLVTHVSDFFEDERLFGTVGYYNGEAAFLLVPFWVAIHLAGSRRVHPVVRGMVLGAAVLCVGLAVMTQSRGAMVAMVASLPVFFVFSGQRLRGSLALAPVAATLFVMFPALNDVYLSFSNRGSPEVALSLALPDLWRAVVGTVLYGIVWGVVDRWWKPPAEAVRVVGVLVLVVIALALTLGALEARERIGNPVAWGQQKWEAFKADDTTGQEQSRYLSASGTGRYVLWQVAWKDFESHPLLGIGTQNYEATYYKLRERPIIPVRQPHMLPLEVLSERGVVGGVLFFGFLGTCLAAGLWSRFTRLSAEGKGQVGALIAAFTYWFVHASTEWFWQLPAVTLPVIIYLAILASPWTRTEAVPVRWPLRAIGMGIAVLAVVTVAPLYIADHYATKASTFTDTNPWLSLQYIERAQQFNPVDPQLPQREAEFALRIGDWPRAKAAYAGAIRLNPEHYAPYALLAMLSDELGEDKKALSLYRDALKRNPLDGELKRKVAKLEKQQPTSRASR